MREVRGTCRFRRIGHGGSPSPAPRGHPRPALRLRRDGLTLARVILEGLSSQASDEPETGFSRTFWGGAFYSFLVGPPIGLALIVAVYAGPDFTLLALLGLAFVYVTHGLPAFVAGGLFALWSRIAPNLVLSLMGGAAIGFVVSSVWGFVLSGLLDGRIPGWVGAVTGFLCAALLEFRWRLPDGLNPPRSPSAEAAQGAPPIPPDRPAPR